jgi:hypothetical protein
LKLCTKLLLLCCADAVADVRARGVGAALIGVLLLIGAVVLVLVLLLLLLISWWELVLVLMIGGI